MKKIGIMTAILLMFSSVFPHTLLANTGEETIESDSEINTLSEEELIVEEDIVEVESEEQVQDQEVEEVEKQGKVIEQEVVEEKGNQELESLEKSFDEKERSVSHQIHKVEYNEYGIKKGTMLYGEDISELSEWELQYIPEGWRDGVVESEHPEESISEQSLKEAKNKYPNVNNYIRSKNFKTAKVKYDHKDFFTKFNYRGGFGKVEGVVAHETANSKSNIAGEIAYMSRNHKNAFVHAFVDHSQIIEIHPTELGAWGAGRFANQRFIHVELVRVHSFDQFARSINNYSNYIANLLYQYDLGVTNADINGQGTLWSHRAVSLFLGGTTHVDPHGYFESWGYNWNDFIKLVRSKHDSLGTITTQSTSKLGHIRNGNVKIYPELGNNSTAFAAGSTYTNAVYYIKKEAKLGGQVFHLISTNSSSTKGVLGWVRAQDMSTQQHVGVDKKAKTFYFKGTGSAYNTAWGGSNNRVYNNLSAYKNQEFNVHLTEKVGNNTWYRGILNGKTVWVHSDYLGTIKETATSQLGHIRNGSVKIYPELGNNSTAYTAGSTYTNAVYYIKKDATVNGQVFHLISTNSSSTKGVLGWVRAQDMSTQQHVGVDKKAKTFYFKGTGSAYNTAWGGSKNRTHKNLSTHKNKIFNAHLTEKVGNNTWYRGKLEGKTVWVHSNYLGIIKETATSKLGHIRNGSVKIYPELGNNSTAITADSTYTNAVYYIKKEATLNGQVFHLISKNSSSIKGVLGWVRAQDMSTQQHVGVDKKAKKFYFKGTGSAYNTAWGGSKNFTHKSLSAHKNKVFYVHLTEKVGNNTWYRGKLDGKTVWVHHSYLKK